MKKTLIAGLLAMSFTAAHAFEVSVQGGVDMDGPDVGVARLGVAQGVSVPVLGKAKLGVEYTYAARADKSEYDQYAITITKDVLNLGFGTVAAKVGAGFLDTRYGSEGGVGLIGAVLTVPITKSIAATVGVEQRYGETKVNSYDHTIATAGVVFKF